MAFKHILLFGIIGAALFLAFVNESAAQQNECEMAGGRCEFWVGGCSPGSTEGDQDCDDRDDICCIPDGNARRPPGGRGRRSLF